MLLAAASIVVTVIQLSYWIALDRGFERSMRRGRNPVRGPIAAPSVVVAARNESARIPHLMEALKRQTLRPAEVVLVDDGSSDETADAARAHVNGQFRLEVLQMNDDGGDKKRALTAGIARSTSDLLAFTDADCLPKPGWLDAIARVHATGTRPRVVIGYSPFRRTRGLLNRLARYETFITGYLSAAAAGLNRPYMAVGRSLSYPRRTFEQVGGFSGISSIRSGDDDLLVQKVARSNAAEVVALLDPESFVLTDAPRSWVSWLRQKRRHVSTARLYDRWIAAHLTVFQTTSVLTWLLPIVLGWIGVALLAFRLVVQFVVLRRGARSLREMDLMPLFIPLEFLYALYNAIVVPFALLFVRRDW